MVLRMSYEDIFFKSMWWFIVSNAFFRSRNTPIIISPKSSDDVMFATSIIIVCYVEWVFFRTQTDFDKLYIFSIKLTT